METTTNGTPIPTPPPPRLIFHGEMGPLFLALARAQWDFPAIPRTRTVRLPQYTFEYAPLDTILACVRGPLGKNELAISQILVGPELITVLGHSSGARIESWVKLPAVDAMQKLGSALTYLRRYTIQGLLGIASEEDDGGNQADGHNAEVKPRRGVASVPGVVEAATAQKIADARDMAKDAAASPSTPAQAKVINDLFKDRGMPQPGMWEWLSDWNERPIARLRDLTEAEAESSIKKLRETGPKPGDPMPKRATKTIATVDENGNPIEIKHDAQTGEVL